MSDLSMQCEAKGTLIRSLSPNGDLMKKPRAGGRKKKEMGSRNGAGDRLNSDLEFQ